MNATASMLSILALAAPLFVVSARGNDGPIHETNEAYGVYNILLEASSEQLVRDTTLTPPMSDTPDSLRRWVKGLDRDTAEDFLLRNSQPIYLFALLRGRTRWTFLTDSELNVFSPEDPEKRWNALRAKYPGKDELKSFSRIGFNANGTQALVIMSFSCGPLCGQGRYYLLSKTRGTWKVRKEAEAWISRGSILHLDPPGWFLRGNTNLSADTCASGRRTSACSGARAARVRSLRLTLQRAPADA